MTLHKLSLFRLREKRGGARRVARSRTTVQGLKPTVTSLMSLFEDNKYDVIIEPAGLYWLEMANHWPKTKFIQLVRDIESWETSASNFLKAIMPATIPHGAILNQVFYENEHISPTAHHALHKGLEPYPQYIVRDHEISSSEFWHSLKNSFISWALSFIFL